MDMILWSSQKPPMRYFWVPEGEDVFVGDYGIENSEGEVFSVDLESLIPFEISGAEAEALMMHDLENMTKELGGLFKGLFQLGKRMLDTDILEDTDVDSDDESDSEANSEDDVDLDNILALFDEADSDEWDSEDSSDDAVSSLDELIEQFGADLEGPLTELRDIIHKEVGSLGNEFKETDTADDATDAGQNVLRELGQWLIQLAEEQEASSEEASSEEDSSEEDSNDDDSVEEPTIMPFPTIPEPEFVHDEVSDDDTASEASSPASVTDENIQEETDTELALDEAPLQATEIESPEVPTASALKRLNKSQLVELAETWGLSLSTSQSKKDLLAAIETLR